MIGVKVNEAVMTIEVAMTKGITTLVSRVKKKTKETSWKSPRSTSSSARRTLSSRR